ncbi:MAG: CRISPR-associated helicase Cas3' [Candidatus Wallbacteria bacterium]|nr:CRISPR-associated helicase Cas3' [Candidatus Wallbacteria bacterium]
MYAHSLADRPESEWHLLRDHLEATAQLASQFGAVFGSGQWSALAGLWHDLGKYSPAFQQRIGVAADAHCEGSSPAGRVDHSTAGAIHAVEKLDGPGRLLAYLIAGHHAGLPDWQTESAGAAGLEYRLGRQELLEQVLRRNPPTEILDAVGPSERPPAGCDPSFWLRMLFSCLVDADYLDTERFYDPASAASRGVYPTPAELLPSLNKHLDGLVLRSSPTAVNAIRREVLERCRLMAKCPPDAYSLTVPTGGGKTLSSLAFALDHAARHGKRRVIYVIPYTSIIEQTADTFRRLFGSSVVEHHSALEPRPGAEDRRSRLACENWDAPLIVTTSVQFFESLHASRPSRCRKLHNIAQSVVVLDEAQMLPPELLSPIMRTLCELRRHYGVTLLLTTATQPALEPRHDGDLSFEGLADVVELIPDPSALHRRMRRVRLQLPEDLERATSWSDLAAEIRKHPSVLVIVNRRKDAFDLHRLLPTGAHHLSGLMCGAHRSTVLDRIRNDLIGGQPTVVVSTQLVEAGVDIDFPVVYRALAGLDSIAQAAGRCNREGRLDVGLVHVFVPERPPPVGHLRMAAECTRRLLERGQVDCLEPSSFDEFFRDLYWQLGQDRLDSNRVLECLPKGTHRFSFRLASQRFQMISDENQGQLIIPYGERGREIVETLRAVGPSRDLYRRLQRFTVQVPRRDLERLVSTGDVTRTPEDLHILAFDGLYDDVTGLRLFEETAPSMESEGFIL